MLSYLSAASAFALAHAGELAIAAVVLLSLANKLLPGHPHLAGVTRRVVDLFTLIPMPGAKSAALLFLAGKLGPNAAGAFIDWLSKYLSLPLSPSVPTSPAPASELAEPRGFVRLSVLFAAAGALLIGVLAFHGFYEAVVVVFVIFAGLLAFGARRNQALFLLALLLGGQTSCALSSSAGRARLAQDLLACGISVGLTELTQVDQAAHAILEDGKISEDEVHAALDGLAQAAKPGLAACVVTLIHDSTSSPTPPGDPAPTSPGFAPASLRAAFESKPQRARRRAETWLAKRASLR